MSAASLRAAAGPTLAVLAGLAAWALVAHRAGPLLLAGPVEVLQALVSERARLLEATARTAISAVGPGVVGIYEAGGISTCASDTNAPSGFTCPVSSGGSFVNLGQISMQGTAIINQRGNNAEAGSAIIIANSIAAARQAVARIRKPESSACRASNRRWGMP